MFPNEEFLPKVPDPEDVVLDYPPESNSTLYSDGNGEETGETLSAPTESTNSPDDLS